MKKILIADKNQDTITMLTSRLEARGYEVLQAESSVLALRMVTHETPDVILLDAHMEKIQGEDLPRAIKRHVHNQFIPIIMMTERDNIAEQVLGMHWGFDDIILKPFNPLELQLRITMNIKRATESAQANPLTKLPGNIAIEQKLKECIASGEKYSVCYLDIDNFKSFNDKYGFDKGDDVIVQTARIIMRAVQQTNDPHIFVGHVGGDDYVAVMKPEYEELFARTVITEFDRLIPTHYTKEDQEQESIIVKNRRGVQEQFPLMGISIAAVTNLTRVFSNPGEIAQTAAEVKKYLKTQKGSNYLRDRREQQLDTLADVEHIIAVNNEEKEGSEPLGQILLDAGLITHEQLQEALKKHFATGQRLGRILIHMKVVSSAKVGAMLQQKLGVPYVSLGTVSLSSKMQHMFTGEYVRMHGVIPFKKEGSMLHVAMIDPFDLKTIDEIERITACDVHPYIALEEEMAECVERYFSGE